MQKLSLILKIMLLYKTERSLILILYFCGNNVIVQRLYSPSL